MKSLGNVLLRIVAVFAAGGLSVVGAGAVAGVSMTTAILIAGLTAVAAVIEKLARGFIDDGKLDLYETNAAFLEEDDDSKTTKSGQEVVVHIVISDRTKADVEVLEEHPIDEDWNKE
jgi:hypothetical protein